MKADLETIPLATLGAVQGGYRYGVKPFLEGHAAQVGWGMTLALPGVYDYWALKTGHETLSHAFRAANQHPIYRYLCLGAIGGLAVHLMREP